MNTQDFIFGIYPGGMSGTDTGLTSGKTDDPEAIKKAITQLKGESPFIIRAYIGYYGKEKAVSVTPTNLEHCIPPGCGLDLVLCFQTEEDDMDGWAAFICSTIHQHKKSLVKLQVTEEANVDLPFLDGHFKHSRRALVSGILAAKEEIKALSLPVQVGFNATPDFSPNKYFWKEVGSLANEDFRLAVDYVGIDFFPDVFRPLGSLDLGEAIRSVIGAFRQDMRSIGLNDTTPLHVTENGWPTGRARTEDQQSLILKKIITLIYGLRNEFNIRSYELFSLRDADSSNPDIFHQFGIMHDDYTPKKVFPTYQRLISEFNRPKE